MAANENPHERHRKRMRERFLTGGFEGFAPHEIVEFLLFFTIARGDTNPLGHALINTFGSLAQVLEATPEELMQVPGVGDRTAVLIKTYCALFPQYMRSRWEQRPQIMGAPHAAEFMASYFIGVSNERLYCVCLDSGLHITCVEMISEGTVDESSAYPRKCVEAAIRHRAKAVMLAHNHPGGNVGFTKQDITATHAIQRALKTIEVRVVDHLVMSGTNFASGAKQGWLLSEELGGFAKTATEDILDYHC